MRNLTILRRDDRRRGCDATSRGRHVELGADQQVVATSRHQCHTKAKTPVGKAASLDATPCGTTHNSQSVVTECGWSGILLIDSRKGGGGTQQARHAANEAGCERARQRTSEASGWCVCEWEDGKEGGLQGCGPHQGCATANTWHHGNLSTRRSFFVLPSLRQGVSSSETAQLTWIRGILAQCPGTLAGSPVATSWVC